jgi:hypothetical protein
MIRGHGHADLQLAEAQELPCIELCVFGSVRDNGVYDPAVKTHPFLTDFGLALLDLVALKDVVLPAHSTSDSRQEFVG